MIYECLSFYLFFVFISGLSVSMTMGFSGFGKKAREFDLEKMMEESRKHAAERNKLNLGNSAVFILNQIL